MEFSLLDMRLRKYLGEPQVGKVRDVYRLKIKRKRYLLAVVSDRASIFDFKLGTPISGKGELLNAFNVLAKLHRRKVLGTDRLDDLVAYGKGIDMYLPKALRNNKELQKRATVVEELEMLHVECVTRMFVGGNLWNAIKGGKKFYCGQKLPQGLNQGDQLPRPFFTPTTKARKGHDLPRDYRKIEKLYPGLKDQVVADFMLMHAYARERGIIIVDGKAEYGRRRGKGPYILADEYCTPDANRFWRASEYEELFPRQLPAPMDKQRLRIWGMGMCLDNPDFFDPKKPSDAAHVFTIPVPEKVIEEYVEQMELAFEMLWK